MTEHKKHTDLDQLPEWILPLFRGSIKRLKNEDQFLHLTMRGLSSIPHQVEILEYFRKTNLERDKDRDWDSEIKYAKKAVEWVDKEIASGFPILHSHSIVALWSIVEVLCEDLLVYWLLNNNSAWKIPELSNIKIRLGEYDLLSKEDRARYSIYELSRSLSLELKTGIGKFGPMLKLFGLKPKVGKNLKCALHELCQVRNIIVHCDGRVDRKFAEQCPWVTTTIGERIRLSHAIYYWYYSAAERYIERVMSQTFIALGHEGCNCPGMDEIHERPKEDENSNKQQIIN